MSRGHIMRRASGMGATPLGVKPAVQGAVVVEEDAKGNAVYRSTHPVGGTLLHALMARSSGKALEVVKKPRRGRPPKSRGVVA